MSPHKVIVQGNCFAKLGMTRRTVEGFRVYGVLVGVKRKQGAEGALLSFFCWFVRRIYYFSCALFI